MFARLINVREDIERVYKHLEALSTDPTNREAARQLRASLESAEGGLKWIRDNVSKIAVEPRPEAGPATSSPPPAVAAKPDDLERRLREVERKLDELLEARSNKR